MVTRLIIGGNPLVGNSHYSQDLTDEMLAYFTPEQVVATLNAAQAAGINTVVARGDYHRVLHWLELFRRQGGRLQWIAQTATEMHDIFQNIRILAAAGATGIYLHGCHTDNLYLAGEIDKAQDYLKAIRDTGVQTGLATHIPEVIEYADEHDWDIDFHMACFYNLSVPNRQSAAMASRAECQVERFAEEDPPRMCRAIRQSTRMCLAFKILAANRLCRSQDQVHQAFKFAFDNIKSTDAIVVGMFCKHVDQIAMNVEHTLRLCQPLRSSRSQVSRPALGAKR